MSRSVHWVLAFLLTTLAACAAMQTSMDVRTDRNPSGTFASYATYAWARPPIAAPQWPDQDDRASFDWTVRSLVDREMSRLGYQQTSLDRADLVLDYSVVTREEELDDSFGAYSRYLAEGGTESSSTAWVMGYERGILTVNAADPRLRSLVWFGRASAVVNPSLRAKRLPEAIEKMFATFPPRTAP